MTQTQKILLVPSLMAALLIASVAIAQNTEDGGADVASSTPDKQPIRVDALGDPLPPFALLRLGSKRFSVPGASGILLSPDNKIVLVQLIERLQSWDAETGKLIWEKQFANNEEITTGSARYGFKPLALLPQSKQALACVEAGKIARIDFATVNQTDIELPVKEIFYSIDVTADETLMAVGNANMLLVCDLQGKEKYRVNNSPEKKFKRNNRDRLTFGGEFSYGIFSPDGKTLALVNSASPEMIQILDAETGELQKEIATKAHVVRMDFFPDSQSIVTTERDIAARRYDFVNGTEVNGTEVNGTEVNGTEVNGTEVWEKKFSIPGNDERYTTDIKVSPDGDVIAVGTAIGEDQRIRLIDPETGEPVGELSGHTWKPWALQFTSDGKRLFSIGWDAVIRRWDVAKREQIRLKNVVRASGVCAMSPDGKLIAFSDDTRKLYLADASTGTVIKTLEFTGAGNSQLAFSADSKLLASGGSSENDIHVYVWQLDNFDVKHHWEWPKGKDIHSSVQALSFSADSKRLGACVFRQSMCYVFDLPSDQQLLKGRHKSVYGMSMSSDGKQFVSAGWDKHIRLWDCESRPDEDAEILPIKEVEVKDPLARDTRMYGVLFSPDGKTIATLGMSSTLNIWNADLEPTGQIDMESGVSYGSFAFSHNGRWIAVGHYLGRAAIYDLDSLEWVWNSQNHDQTVYNVAFGADDCTLLTGGGDGVDYLTELTTTITHVEVDARNCGSYIYELGSTDPQTAFIAHQFLAKHSAAAIAAFDMEFETLFGPWENGVGLVDEDGGEAEDNKQAVKKARTFRKIALLLSQMREPAVDDLLKRLIDASPDSENQKGIFPCPAASEEISATSFSRPAQIASGRIHNVAVDYDFAK